MSIVELAQKRRELVATEADLGRWRVQVTRLEAEREQARAVFGDAEAIRFWANARVFEAMTAPRAITDPLSLRPPGPFDPSDDAPAKYAAALAAHTRAAEDARVAGIEVNSWESHVFEAKRGRDACAQHRDRLSADVERLAAERAVLVAG